MAKRRLINTKFWSDGYISELSPSEKLLFIYLLTNPYTNISGAYEISLKQMALDTGFERTMVEEILERFKTDDKILYLHGYIVIKNFIKHQELNPKVLKGVENEALNLPNDIKNIVYDSLSHLNLNSNLIKYKGEDTKTIKQVKTTQKFKKPEITEVKVYCSERKNKVDPQRFLDYYESNGWRVGRNPMKDWKATIRTWEKNNNTSSNSPPVSSSISDQARAYAKRVQEDEDERERVENAKHNDKVREANLLTRDLVGKMKI